MQCVKVLFSPNAVAYITFKTNKPMQTIKKNEIGGACSTYGERRGAYRVLVGKPEGKRPLGASKPRWEDNIGMDLQEVGCGGGAWTGLFWLRIGTGGRHL